MTVDLVVSNTRAFLKDEIINCNLAIDDGKIFKIGKEAAMPKAAAKMDLDNLLVLPGLIDVHVHLRDEGKAYKEDFYSGTAAAAAGGFTAVLDMPNNDPVTMSRSTLKNRMLIAERKAIVNVAFFSEFPKETEEIRGILEEGAIAFKLYMAEQVGGLNIDDDCALLEAFRTLSGLNILVAVHAEDKAELKRAEDELKRADQNDVEAFLRAHSNHAEAKAVKRLQEIAKQANVQMHFCHISTKEALGEICEGKKSTVRITCETTPHNLFLDSDDLNRIGTLALTMPPVRDKNQVTVLWNGLKNGRIDILASDHAPHALVEKNAKAIWDVKVGIPGLETTLPLLLTAVKHGCLSIRDVVRVMSEKPAEIFGLTSKGRLMEKNDADLTVVDLDKKGKIDASKFQSKAKYSPFDGWTIEGKPVKTFVKGQLVMDEGEIVAKAGSGQIIRREEH